jgi:uncharacterized protein YndB with AHSA1/START domain
MKWLLLVLAALALLLAVMAIAGALLPRDHVASRAATFLQPPEKLFAALRDFAALPTWRTGLNSVELLPPENGLARYREITKHGPVTYRVRVERPGEQLVLEIADENLPYGGTWTFDFARTATGTQVRITERGFVKPVLFRFLARYAFGYTTTIEQSLRDLGKKFGETPAIEP